MNGSPSLAMGSYFGKAKPRAPGRVLNNNKNALRLSRKYKNTVNTFYFDIALYFYNKYIHETFLNDPHDIDSTYNKMKHLIDFSVFPYP